MERREIFKRIYKDYDRKQSLERQALEERRGEIYERLPRIKAIDEEITKKGLKASVLALENTEDSEKIAQNFREEIKALTKEKEAILKENSIPKKYLEIHYDCKLCKDTGYIKSEPCKCFVQKKVAALYSDYSLSDRLKAENFDNFNFNYYDDKKPEDGGISPKKNIEMIYTVCVRYVKNFETKRPSLLFYGKPGLGKTFLCNAVAKELIGKGYGVMYLTAFQIFKMLEDIQFNRLTEEEKTYTLDDMLTVDLLIIDDLGTEFITAVTSSAFFNILNLRANLGKPVIISTNLDINQLKELYSERIFSRINGDYSLLEFHGEDIRSLKKYGKIPNN